MAAVTIPILASADFDLTGGFWSGLGFTETGRWPQEYLILRHSELGVELHFWHDPGADRWTNDTACFVRFDTPAEAVACHAGWAEAPIPVPAELRPPTTDDSGAVEFQVIDPYGNLVRLGGFPGRE